MNVAYGELMSRLLTSSSGLVIHKVDTLSFFHIDEISKAKQDEHNAKDDNEDEEIMRWFFIRVISFHVIFERIVFSGASGLTMIEL